MPLSTSNSEIPYRKIPTQPWRPIMLASAVVIILLTLAWELLARKMHHTPGTYQSAYEAMWADERRKLDVPDNDIRIVLTGSSRILWDSDLDILESALGTRPLQLAIAGTSPAIFVEDVVNNTDFDGLLIVGVTPFLFNDISDGKFGRGALDWYHNAAPSQWSGIQLHNFLSDYLAFLDDGFTLFGLIDRYSQLPKREGAINLHYDVWKLGNYYADRQTDMWAPVEERGSFENIEITNFWQCVNENHGTMTADETKEMVTATIGYFQPLIQKLRGRGGDILFIRMPSDGAYKQIDLASGHRENIWQPMIAGFDSPAINCMDYPELSSDMDIPEWSHMTRKSQDLWSQRIVPYMEKAYSESRGRTIYKLMSLPAPSK